MSSRTLANYLPVCRVPVPEARRRWYECRHVGPHAGPARLGLGRRRPRVRRARRPAVVPRRDPPGAVVPARGRRRGDPRSPDRRWGQLPRRTARGVRARRPALRPRGPAEPAAASARGPRQCRPGPGAGHRRAGGRHRRGRRRVRRRGRELAERAGRPRGGLGGHQPGPVAGHDDGHRVHHRLGGDQSPATGHGRAGSRRPAARPAGRPAGRRLPRGHRTGPGGRAGAEPRPVADDEPSPAHLVVDGPVDDAGEHGRLPPRRRRAGGGVPVVGPGRGAPARDEQAGRLAAHRGAVRGRTGAAARRRGGGEHDLHRRRRRVVPHDEPGRGHPPARLGC